MSSNINNQNNPIAIIGLGCLFPKAGSRQEFWHILRSGTDCIGPVPETHWSVNDLYDGDHSSPDRTYAKVGGFLEPYPFDPTEFSIPPNALEATDTSQLLGLVGAKAALEDAGYGPGGKAVPKDTTSVILGVTGALEMVIPLGARLGHPRWRKALAQAGIDKETADSIVESIANSYVSWQENSFPGLLGNVVAGRIANKLDLHGTNCAVDAACASSLAAVHLAVTELQQGTADMVVTGGTDTFNDIFMFTCFSKTPALSGTGHIAPFSQDSDGTLLGEGVGILVLKRLDDAERDHDRIYAVIKGLGSSSDGNSGAIYAPSAPGQSMALRRAYEQAGIAPSTIGVIEAHGTGTKVGDVVEFEALKQVFGEYSRPADGSNNSGAQAEVVQATNEAEAVDKNAAAQADTKTDTKCTCAGAGVIPEKTCALGTVKSQIGHTKASAGAASLCKAAFSLFHKVILPTLNVSSPNPKLGIETTPFYLNTETRPWVVKEGVPRRSGVSSFGFGGSNFHVVLEEYSPERTVPAWDGSVQIWAMSASRREDLIASLRSAAACAPYESTYQASLSRRNFAVLDPFRALLVCDSKDYSEKLNAFAKALEDGSELPEASYYGDASSDLGKLAILFPGQGSQYVGMGRDIFNIFPEALDTLELADKLLDKSQSPANLIFPIKKFTENEDKLNTQAITDTRAAQPCLGAAESSLAAILEYFGVKPQAMAGHSYGELVALQRANVYTQEDLFRLSALRGTLMAAGDNGRGAMSAVSAPLETIEEIVKEVGQGLVLANRNHPTQGVISGPKEAIAQAEALCKERNITAKRLQVSAAFHSSLMAAAQEPFCQALNKVELQVPQITVYANVTGQPYGGSADEVRRTLGEQLVSSVHFIDIIENMYKAGFRTFLEVGPKTVLTGLTKKILGDRPHNLLSTDSRKGGGELRVLAMTLANLAALGYPVKLEAWEENVPEPRHKRMIVPICGANYRTPGKHAPAPSADPVKPVDGYQPIKYVSDNPVKNPAKTPELKSLEIEEPPSPGSPAAYQANQTFAHNIQSGAASGFPMPQVDASSLGSSNPALAYAPAFSSMAQTPVTSPAALQSTPMLAQAMRTIEVGLQAMQTLQEQTAAAHLHFLESQVHIQQTLQSIVAYQQNLARVALGLPAEPLPPISLPAMPTSASMVPETAPSGHPLATPTGTIPVSPRPAVASSMPFGTAAFSTAMPPALPISQQGQADKSPHQPEQNLHLSQPPVSPGTPDVTVTVLRIVAEMTGYPADMLHLDMNLESDLGIDSIKRVEILAAIQKQLPQACSISPDELGTLQTLRQIAEKLQQSLIQSGSASYQTMAASVPRSAAETFFAEIHGQEDHGRVGVPSVQVSTKAQQTTAPNVDASAILLQVVAETTGYPIETLNLDMDLENDLGVDSIKRVEILAAIQKQLPNAANISPDEIGSLHTLRQILEKLAPQASQVATPDQGKAQASGNSGASADQAAVQSAVLEIIAQMTGYPMETLDPSMDLENDLGIDSIKRVEILAAVQKSFPEAATITPEEIGELHTLRDIMKRIAPTGTPSEPAGKAAQATAPVAEKTTQQAGKGTGSPEEHEDKILAVVSQMTGYPRETLDLDMDLENDLGIDSIKRVEILAAVQKSFPEAAAITPDEIGELHTLRDIVERIVLKGTSSEPAGKAAQASTPGVETKQADTSPLSPQEYEAKIMAIVAQMTGYPLETLDLDMDLENDLGIDSIKRVEILAAVQKNIPAAASISSEELNELHTLRDILNHLQGEPTPPTSPDDHGPKSNSDKSEAEPQTVVNTIDETGRAAQSQSAQATSAGSNFSAADSKVSAYGAVVEKRVVETMGALLKASGSPQVATSVTAPAPLASLQTGLAGLGSVSTSTQANFPAPVQSPPKEELQKLNLPHHVEIHEKMEEEEEDVPELELTPKLLRRKLSYVESPTPNSPAELDAQGVYAITDDGFLAPALSAALEEIGLSTCIINAQEDNLAAFAEEYSKLAGLIVLMPRFDMGNEDEFFAQRVNAEEALKECFRIVRNQCQLWKARSSSLISGYNSKQARANGTIPSLFLTITRMDGRFGTTGQDCNPLEAGLHGLSRVIAQEYPHMTCRSFDLSPELTASQATQRIIEEMLTNGSNEVGLGPDSRVISYLSEEEEPENEASGLDGLQGLGVDNLPEDSTILVTGGARGVTAECLKFLAQKRRLKFVLVGRSPIPTAEWVGTREAKTARDLKSLLYQLARQNGRSISPKQLEQDCRKILVNRELLQNIAAIRAYGSQVEYVSMDVRDGALALNVVEDIHNRLGPVVGFVHAAGALADRFVADKTDEQFDIVFDTKVEGLYNFMQALQNEPLQFVLTFSSVSARFGRPGQCDYAMANEVMNKFIYSARNFHPLTRFVAMGWGPWQGGMVDASLERTFRRLGVEVIKRERGAEAFTAEVLAGQNNCAELIMGQGFDVPHEDGSHSPSCQCPKCAPKEKSFPFFSGPEPEAPPDGEEPVEDSELENENNLDSDEGPEDGRGLEDDEIIEDDELSDSEEADLPEESEPGMLPADSELAALAQPIEALASLVALQDSAEPDEEQTELDVADDDSVDPADTSDEQEDAEIGDSVDAFEDEAFEPDDEPEEQLSDEPEANDFAPDEDADADLNDSADQKDAELESDSQDSEAVSDVAEDYAQVNDQELSYEGYSDDSEVSYGDESENSEDYGNEIPADTSKPYSNPSYSGSLPNPEAEAYNEAMPYQASTGYDEQMNYADNTLRVDPPQSRRRGPAWSYTTHLMENGDDTISTATIYPENEVDDWTARHLPGQPQTGKYLYPNASNPAAYRLHKPGQDADETVPVNSTPVLPRHHGGRGSKKRGEKFTPPFSVGGTVPAATPPPISVDINKDTKTQENSEVLLPTANSYECLVNAQNYPLLNDHIIGGNAVMPLALMVELAAQACCRCFPGSHFCGCDNLRVLRSITLPKHETELQSTIADSHVIVEISQVKRQGSQLWVDFSLNHRKPDKKPVKCVTGTIVLAEEPPTLPSQEKDIRQLKGKAYPRPIDEAYDSFLFHGPNLRGINRIRKHSDSGLWADIENKGRSTQGYPNLKPIADPLFLDCALQSGLLWSGLERGLCSLPMFGGQYRQYVQDFPEHTEVVLYPKEVSEHQLCGDIFLVDSEGRILAEWRDVHWVMSSSLLDSFRNNHL
ncbi:MAG: SDR family NAD(P)-dependent oxidoreductase [bacterium]|nr:SDR family NAD(P)-dependent oxidoreductase [bacterium]